MLDTCHKALAIINSSVCFMRARKSNGINKYKNIPISISLVFELLSYSLIQTSAIISNIDSENSPDGFGKSYYIENVKDNYYGIKSYDTDTNSFNTYLTSSENGLIKLNTLSKTNTNQHWILDTIRDDKNEVKYEDGLVLVHLKNKASNKCFVQSYDQHGISIEKEEDCNSGSFFKFQSFNGDIL